MEIYNPDGTLSKKFPIQRLIARYPFIFPLKMTKEEFFHVQDYLKDIHPSSDILVTSSRSYDRAVFLSLILKSGKFLDVKHYDLFSLTELWLGKDDDVNSLSNVAYDYLAITAGSQDTPNKNYQNVLSYLLTTVHRSSDSGRWIFYRGHLSSLKERMPAILEAIPKVVSIPPIHGGTIESMCDDIPQNAINYFK